jgi:adenosylmethionine-8-amino-7-oxononanoate aminotransferase
MAFQALVLPILYHSNPLVIEAVQQQAQQYMHLIVYGEFIQQPQVAYAKKLIDYLPQSLNCVLYQQWCRGN